MLVISLRGRLTLLKLSGMETRENPWPNPPKGRALLRRAALSVKGFG